jgi:hypothetical protein
MASQEPSELWPESQPAPEAQCSPPNDPQLSRRSITLANGRCFALGFFFQSPTFGLSFFPTANIGGLSDGGTIQGSANPFGAVAAFPEAIRSLWGSQICGGYIRKRPNFVPLKGVRQSGATKPVQYFGLACKYFTLK